MESSRISNPAMPSGKKLVQARLPFQVSRTPKVSEPPQKKLTHPGEENMHHNIVIPLVYVSDSDSSPIKCDTDRIKETKSVDGNDSAKELNRKQKREKLEESESDDTTSKKRKLDVRGKLSLFADSSKVHSTPSKDAEGDTSQIHENETAPPCEKVKDTSVTSLSTSPESKVVVKQSTSEESIVTLSDDDLLYKETAPSKGRTMSPIAVNVIDGVEDCKTETKTADESLEEASGAIEEAVVVAIKTTPPSKMSAPRKKTPKQAEKEIEAVKRREEKERMKQEKEIKKKMEKEEKQRLKEEKELLRKKEFEEKEELKRKAKEQKEQKRLLEIEIRAEEKRRKEEEKKRKEEELQKKKEDEAFQKNKFAKEAMAFSTFFTKVGLDKTRKSEGLVETAEQVVVFKPFAVKNRMRLAPLNRNPLDEPRKTTLDQLIISQDVHETYLTQLRCEEIKPGHAKNTWPLEEIYQEDENEVEELPLGVVVNSSRVRTPHAKLLQFVENRRPPYWGTWRRKCSAIGPRRPFGTYKEFEYDVDSDEEWEEEEPGESLHGSDDEKEKEEQDGEDDYDIDNDLFVPHGYLSEDEAPPDETWNVEQQKEKLKLLGEQFDQERNEKTRQLRPIVLGCIWTGIDPTVTAIGNTKVAALLLRCMPWLNEGTLPITLGPDHPDSPDGREGRDVDGLSSAGSVRRSTFPDEATPALLARVHGATVKRRALAKEFATSWALDNPTAPLLSVAAVSRKVRELAQWQECPDPPLQGRFCWFVPRSVREEYGCGDLTLLARNVFRSGADEGDVTPATVSSTPKITKFTKVLTDEERRLALRTSRPSKLEIGDGPPCKMLRLEGNPHILPTESETASPIVKKALQKLNQFRAPDTPIVKKRVAILFSSPCGMPINKSANDNVESTEGNIGAATAPGAEKVGNEEKRYVAEKVGVECIDLDQKDELVGKRFKEEDEAKSELMDVDSDMGATLGS